MKEKLLHGLLLEHTMLLLALRACDQMASDGPAIRAVQLGVHGLDMSWGHAVREPGGFYHAKV